MSVSRKEILKKVTRVVLKIGSGILASREKGLNHERIERIAREVSRLKKKGYDLAIVSSGAIVAGCEKLGLERVRLSIPLRQASAAVGQSRLMWAYEKTFEAQGLRVAQVLLTHDDLTNRTRYLNSRNTLLTLLKHHVIPIINENDTVSVEEIKFGDNDYLAGLVTPLIDAHLLLILSDVDGLYSEDPRKNPAATFIPLVEEVTKEIEGIAGASSSSEGTGGMVSKVQSARRASSHGVTTIIINGEKEGLIEAACAGEDVGTFFLPRKDRLTGRKRWIAHALRSKGHLVLDDGAIEAVRDKGKSLLPSGIVRVEGQFSAGDPVSCLTKRGREVAKGLVNYDSREVERIKGKKTKEIEAVLGYKYYDEVIHRDNLAIL